MIRLFASAVSRVRINQVGLHQSANRPESEYRKTRRFWAQPFVSGANFIFQFRKPKLTVLCGNDWTNWEQKLASIKKPTNSGGHRGLQAVNEAEEKAPTIKQRKRSVATKALQGTPLLTLIRNQNPDNLDAIQSAANSLSQFHLQTVSHEGSNLRLSHGDAACYNALYDSTTHQAHWIDFDIRHDLNCPFEVRQADDLRAFVYSIAAFSPIQKIDFLIEQIGNSYSNTHIWSSLSSLIRSQKHFRFDVFHWAQMHRANSQASGKLLNHISEHVSNSILRHCS